MRFGIAILLQALPLLVLGRFSNFDAVPAPQHEPVRLMDAIAEDGSVVYSDEASRLTSVKDNNFKACFITDLDPEWNLDINEKQELVDTHEPEIVRSPLQYENLKIRTGDMIAMMCKKSKIYWLTETHSQPLQSARSADSDSPGLPPRVYHPIVPSHSGVPHHAPSHMGVPQHAPAPQHVPGHMGAPQHVPAHMGAPHHVPGHMGVPHHAPAHMGIPQKVPGHMAPVQQQRPQHVPGHAAFHAPDRVPVAAPHHDAEHIPQPGRFHAPAAPFHQPQGMLVPRHLPFIRPLPPAADPAKVPGKRHHSQSDQDRPMAIPERLSMARPELKNRQ
ncbi:mucin-1-like [Pecten maximus]|uniref:mucin-1-like n=1 Tax=Pecten maximus TaxID=6579 RepID=UPI00145848B6|nr:mucin-1-like [Pecten maximus]